MRQGYQEIYISLRNILEQTLFSQCNWTAHEKYVQMEKGQKDKQCTGFVTGVTRRRPIMEQELLTRPPQLSLPHAIW
jgi:hypothetical protein